MRRSHKQLTLENRYQIGVLLQEGLSNRMIAKRLKISHTTVNNELARLKKYDPKKANAQAIFNKKQASSIQKKMTYSLTKKVNFKLINEQWSPEQIAGRLKTKDGKKIISHQSIYALIEKDKNAGNLLYKNLRRKGKKYRRKCPKNTIRTPIQDRIDISQRPQEVDQKLRYGDYELDTIVGKDHKGAILSIVERKTKYVMLVLLERSTSELAADAIIARLKPHKNLCLESVTSDNGPEFASHKRVSRALEVPFYFARPYKSNDRALNENTNGLVRQYLPKGTDFTKLYPSHIKEIELKLNSRPRKTLGYKTPIECLQEHISKTSGNIHT